MHTCQSPLRSKGKVLFHSHTPEGCCLVNCGDCHAQLNQFQETLIPIPRTHLQARTRFLRGCSNINEHIYIYIYIYLLPYLHPSISTALMRPRRPKQYCLQLVIYIYIYLYKNVFINRIHRIRVDGRPIRNEKVSDTFGRRVIFFNTLRLRLNVFNSKWSIC